MTAAKQELYSTGSILSFPLDENSGNTATDQSGKGNDADIYGASWVTGIMGTALSFDGVDDYLEIINSDILESVNALTISAWIKGGSDTSLAYFISTHGFGVWQQGAFAGLAISVTATNSAGGAILLNQWTFITGTYNGVDIQFYVNGILQATQNHPGVMATGGRNFTIAYFNNNYWDGTIDELNIWNRILSPTEIEKLFKITRERTVFETKTVPGTSIITSAKSDAGYSSLTLSVIFVIAIVMSRKLVKRVH
jgi:hypothetical protein